MAKENVTSTEVDELQSELESNFSTVVSGSQGAIERATGIDIRAIPQVMDGSGVARVEADGREWVIRPWKGGGGFASAHRKMNPEEIEKARRRDLSMTLMDLTKDRWLLCLEVIAQIRDVSERMNPDHPPARAVRRSMRRKLARLTQIQAALLCRESVDVIGYEAELEQLSAA